MSASADYITDTIGLHDGRYEVFGSDRPRTRFPGWTTRFSGRTRGVAGRFPIMHQRLRQLRGFRVGQARIPDTVGSLTGCDAVFGSYTPRLSPTGLGWRLAANE